MGVYVFKKFQIFHEENNKVLMSVASRAKFYKTVHMRSIAFAEISILKNYRVSHFVQNFAKLYLQKYLSLKIVP